MDFVLRYRGPLRASSRPDPAEKQKLREHFSTQLRQLVHREELFHHAALGYIPLASLEKGRMIVPPGLNNRHYAVPVGGYEFIPLIHRTHQLVCELDIVWMRPERPGDIVHGGDLDNRLKNLLDGLRMPLEEKEVPYPPKDAENRRCYCLLEDDALITKLNVMTHQLLEPPAEPPAFDVDLLIHVTVRSTNPSNIGFAT